MNADLENDATAPTLDERRRATLNRCLHVLMQENPQYYYEPTSEVAREIHAMLRRPALIDENEHDAVSSLTVRDIEMLLAYK